MKTFLVAAALLMGGSSAWAAVEITETYDFGAFITANGAGSLTTSGYGIAQTGTSAKVGTVKVIDNLTAGGQTLDLKGRFAVDYQSDAGYQIRFMWRSSSNIAYQHGLAGNWNSKGTADPQGAARFSVLNLKAGDKITFTYAKQSGKAADPYTCRADMLSASNTNVAVDAFLASGTQYTVVADGNVDLYFTNNNFAISKIVIVTTGTESVSEPTIAVTGALAKARKVTITAGASDAGNDVTTYYTIDGSIPTTSSTSFTEATKEITVGENATSEETVTVKAFSVSSTSAASSVASGSVTVGTLVQLAAPSIYLSTFTANGEIFNPTYAFTSDQSGVLSSPSVTYSYSFNEGTSTEGTSYTATTTGSITVTVSADGYSSSSTTQTITGGDYAKTYSFDAINDVTVDTSTGTWTNSTNVNGAQWTFTSLDNCTYSLRSDITLSNIMYARATTAQTKQGFYARLGAGSIAFTLEDDEFILFTTLNGNVIVDGSKTSQSFGQYSNVRGIAVYTPFDEVRLAILDCKKYEKSDAFATAVAAETFETAAEVYTFHTAWQIAQADAASSNDYTKVIRNAAVNDAAATDWDGAGTYSNQQYTGAPDVYFIDNNGAQMWATQMIYGLPAGKYQVKVATRAAEANYSHVYVSYNGEYDICTARGNHVGNSGGELGNGWSWTYVPFEITEEANIKLGFYKDATNWAGCDDWHLYKVTEDQSIEISSAGWATLYTPYALDFSNVSGLEAYTATVSEDVVTLTKVDNIQPRSGVVLKGAEGSYSIPLANSSSTPVGHLKGSVTWATNYSTEYDYYYLALNDANEVRSPCWLKAVL